MNDDWDEDPWSAETSRCDWPARNESRGWGQSEWSDMMEQWWDYRNEDR